MSGTLPVLSPDVSVQGTALLDTELRREAGMAKVEDEVWVQLATRIPKSLHRELKLHCVNAEVSVMDFVVTALKEKLAKAGGRKRAGRDG